MSQPAFAQEIGRPETDQGLISRWEGGKAYPSDDDLVKIARLGGVSLEVFLEDAPSTEDRERREKLAAAKWMERKARELRAEAKEPGDQAAAERALEDARELAQQGKTEEALKLLEGLQSG